MNSLANHPANAHANRGRQAGPCELAAEKICKLQGERPCESPALDGRYDSPCIPRMVIRRLSANVFANSPAFGPADSLLFHLATRLASLALILRLALQGAQG